MKIVGILVDSKGNYTDDYINGINTLRCVQMKE